MKVFPKDNLAFIYLSFYASCSVETIEQNNLFFIKCFFLNATCFYIFLYIAESRNLQASFLNYFPRNLSCQQVF